ncbi:zf-HC2 domain-containing protein [Actinomadura physcomitrii]|uniref:zf-HC2 domain-containing protein n=1 Tax=Actinomadura physcomitrii TaxID=2650748 RepID=UPI00137071CD|nr:zf-HC2 domain-containing protein [Actinomadura physcomitrii]
MEGSGCGEYRPGLGVYALGRLAGAEAEALAAHLRGCPPCRAELAELRGVAELLARTARAGARPRTTGRARATADPRAVRAGRREGAGRGSRSGASVTGGFSGACAYGATGRGRSG